jgi:hypothetical protein
MSSDLLIEIVMVVWGGSAGAAPGLQYLPIKIPLLRMTATKPLSRQGITPTNGRPL